MPRFNIQVPACSTGATGGTFTTLLGLKFANTAGHRARLRSLVVAGAGSGGLPQDAQVALRMRRTDNTADGTSTAVNVNTIAKNDPGSVASNVSAIGKSYSAEPTTKETSLMALGTINGRASLPLLWFDDPPVWGPNQTLLIEAAPGPSSAMLVDISLEWEEF